MTNKRWTPEDDDELRAVFADLSTAEVGLALGRSPMACSCRAVRLGLRKSKERQREVYNRAFRHESHARATMLDEYEEDPAVVGRIKQAQARLRCPGANRCPHGCTADPEGLTPPRPRNGTPCPHHGHPDTTPACADCNDTGLAPAFVDEWGLCYVAPCTRGCRVR